MIDRDKAQGAGEPGPDVVEEIFASIAALEGFDIRGFDTWLSAMEPCGAKRELTERRQWAKDAIRPGDVDRDALLRHLEWMLLRWKYISRTEYLMPLARTGDKHRKASARGAQSKAPPEWHDKCAEAARGLIAAGEQPRNIASKLASRFGKDRTSIDRVLKKAGIK